MYSKIQISFFLIGLTGGYSNESKIFDSKMNFQKLQLIPSDLFDFMDKFYEAGQPEMDSRNLQIDYQGTEFEEPEVLPQGKKIGCNGEASNDDGFDNVDYGDNETNGNF